MNETLYVGIDVSKDKLDLACVTNTETPLRHSIFKNNKDGFEKLHLWTEKLKNKYKLKIIHYCQGFIPMVSVNILMPEKTV